MGCCWHFFSSDLPEGVQQFLSLAGVRRNRPSLQVRMMAEAEGAGSDVVDDVDCLPSVCGRIARIASIHPGRAAVFQISPADHRAAGYCIGHSKSVRCSSIGRFEVGLLAPCGSASREHIGRSGIQGAVRCLVVELNVD